MRAGDCGFYALADSARRGGLPEPSHGLAAMSIDPQAAHGAVRFSWSRYTMPVKIDRTVEVLAEVIRRVSTRMAG